MTPLSQQLFTIAHSTDISAARRAGAAMAGRLGFSETVSGKLAIVITEAATNILKHAGNGRVILGVVSSGRRVGIEVLALDNGPGIVNLDVSLMDGISTAGTPGNGLGAMRRLCDEFDVYAAPGHGAAFLMRVWNEPAANAAAPASGLAEVGVVCLPLPGEESCGDGWSVRIEDGAADFVVVDGLGHGPEAARAAHAAVNTFDERPGLPPARMVQAMHEALKPTRGAALAVAHVDGARQEMNFAGIGNIGAAIYIGDTGKQLVSLSGIVGHNLRKVQDFTAPCPAASICVMASDGLSRQWDLAPYPGLRQCHPSLIAGVLYRDFCRGRDDVTVLVAKIGILG